MDPKEYLTNTSFCPIPWTGFMYNSNGDVLNCIRSQRPIGNIIEESIHSILEKNTKIKRNMLDRQPGAGCDGCYDLESEHKGNFNVISDRIFYLKELKTVDSNLYDKIDNFDLRKIDIRWSNVCNHSCIYCTPEYSSKWANELKISIKQPQQQRIEELKKFVFDNAHQLKHVYLAGGEPLLMKENEELLELLLLKNPNVNIRVNTNLSKTGTRVFYLLTKFSNVHWTISLDEMGDEFEYVRYGGKWKDFLENLDEIKELPHLISFNMLHHLLNYLSIFDCVEFLQSKGFHNNSFIIGPITKPKFLDVRHLPKHVLDSISDRITSWLDKKPNFLLENSLQNMLKYINIPIEKNLDQCLEEIAKLDQRRRVDSRIIYKEFYSLIEGK